MSWAGHASTTCLSSFALLCSALQCANTHPPYPIEWPPPMQTEVAPLFQFLLFVPARPSIRMPPLVCVTIHRWIEKSLKRSNRQVRGVRRRRRRRRRRQRERPGGFSNCHCTGKNLNTKVDERGVVPTRTHSRINTRTHST